MYLDKHAVPSLLSPLHNKIQWYFSRVTPQDPKINGMTVISNQNLTFELQGPFRIQHTTNVVELIPEKNASYSLR